MNNLIITVISIALVAVTAVTGIFYGGAAYNSYTAQSRANMLVNQSKQIIQTSTQYMIDNGKTSFNEFYEDDPGLAGYQQNRIPFASIETKNQSGGLQFITNNLRSTEKAGSTMDGVSVGVSRSICQINGINKVIYYSGTGVDIGSTAQADHPLVKMCLKLNANFPFPSGTTMAPNGLPYAPAAGSTLNCRGTYYNTAVSDGYCYVFNSGSTYLGISFSN